jgi:hypothetical protein
MRELKVSILNTLVITTTLLLINVSAALSQISVTLPNTTGTVGTAATIPITVSDLTGQNVCGFSFNLFYDKNVIYLTGASTTGLTLTGGTDPTVNADTANGRLVVAWARTSAISGAGTLVNLNVTYRNSGTSSLTFVNPSTSVNTFNMSDCNTGLSKSGVSTNIGSATVQGIAVRFENVTNVGKGDTVLIPISTTTLNSGHNVVSFEFTATFTQSIIQVLGAENSALSSGGSLTVNPNNAAGTVNVAWARATPIIGSGTLINLRVKVIGRGTANLNFTSFIYNAGSPGAATQGGTLTSANRAPSINSISPKSVVENLLLTFTASGSDPDEGDVLRFSLPGTTPTGAAIDSSTGVFSWTPSVGQAGNYNVIIRATDPGSLYAETTAAITVTASNRKPVFTAISPLIGRVGDTTSFTVSATDPDGDPITYSYIGTPPAGAAFNPLTRVFLWVPTNAQVGSHTLRFKAQDPAGLYDSMAVAITVVRINRPPVFTKQLPDTNAFTHQAFSFKYEAADPESDTVRFFLLSSITGLKIDSVTGILTWTPLKSQLGVHNITVAASDNEASTISRVSKLTVVLANIPPVFTRAIPDTSIKENSTLTYQYLGSDSDPGDVLRFGLAVKPAGASIDSISGIFTWAPTYDQARVAPYLVIATLTDGYAVVYDSVLITVQNVNRPPVFTRTMPDTTIRATLLFRFEYSVTDPDIDPISFLIVSGQQPGMTINDLGIFSWTPLESQVGTYNLVVGATDFTDTAKATSKITVVPFVSVEDDTGVPKVYALHQNYPNPFNPSTVISYQLSAASHVTLKVYDVLGREIATLVEEVMEAGVYNSVFQIPHSALSSGVYYYRLQAGEFVSIKKMILIK